MKVTKIAIHRTIYHDLNKRWQVSWKQDSKKHRQFFKMIKDAQKFADEMRPPVAKPAPRKRSLQGK